ncbi:Cu2+-exporting ATPase [Rhodoblastus acidophilus]|uniref:heavy metal translocating P-type ATPase n=1 Tax=Rhodoblastus acidophilus TaxID=1074 RepID=UPI0022256546|nr:heavy metal translocating P-type ATPase [Rhodoblastus acidophilus]MCW2284442.1 Cu2+-exporting ATPase [Rhodoblastus acidophilus]MCW2333289.1 Cu2+-exporting ATPase [Rhodoblastus acidophilus]
MGAAPDFTHFVRTDEDGRSRLDLAIDGITCAACLPDIETAMKRLPGVKLARLNLTSHRLALTYDPQQVEPARFTGALEAIGYRAYPYEQRQVEADEQARFVLLLKCLGVAVFAAMNIMLLSISVWSGQSTSLPPETRDFFHLVSAVIALPAAAYAGQPFFTSAWAAIRQRRLNMDVPITIGVTLALGLSVYETQHHADHAYFDSAIMLLAFLLAGRVVDQAMRRRTKTAAGNLAALKGENALRFDGAEWGLVPVAALAPGDRLLVRAGERVPADGVIVEGLSAVDESAITGETDPKPVEPGDHVYAGTVNGEGALTVDVTAAGHSALIDEAARLIEQAGAARSRYMQLSDRVSQLYAPAVHLTALVTGLSWWLFFGASPHDALVIAISVLIITCPCALALAVPTVQAMASGAFFRSGLFLNDARGLEKLGEIDAVVFDKTGTLTLPQAGVANADEIPADLLELAGRLARSSHHPLALALARSLRARAPLPEARETSGQGVSAPHEGDEARLGSAAFCAAEHLATDAEASSIYVRAGERVAQLSIRQSLRPDAARVVAHLRDAGLDLHILSGDRAEAVAPVAEKLGIADWRGGQKPAEKIAFVEALKAQGKRVLMVGDGLNDAPALAAAHASISPIDAVHLTQGQADAVFLGDRLLPVAAALAISQQARALMKQNLGFAIVYNAIAVPVAMAGHASPLFAALAMSGSSILVTLNALRLRGPGKSVTLLAKPLRDQP